VSKQIDETREAKRQRKEICEKINAIVAGAPSDMTFVFAVHNEGGTTTKIFSRKGRLAVISAFGAIAMRFQKEIVEKKD